MTNRRKGKRHYSASPQMVSQRNVLMQESSTDTGISSRRRPGTLARAAALGRCSLLLIHLMFLPPLHFIPLVCQTPFSINVRHSSSLSFSLPSLFLCLMKMESGHLRVISLSRQITRCSTHVFPQARVI